MVNFSCQFMHADEINLNINLINNAQFGSISFDLHLFYWVDITSYG